MYLFVIGHEWLMLKISTYKKIIKYNNKGSSTNLNDRMTDAMLVHYIHRIYK